MDLELEQRPKMFLINNNFEYKDYILFNFQYFFKSVQFKIIINNLLLLNL